MILNASIQEFLAENQRGEFHQAVDRLEIVHLKNQVSLSKIISLVYNDIYSFEPSEKGGIKLETIVELVAKAISNKQYAMQDFSALIEKNFPEGAPVVIYVSGTC